MTLSESPSPSPPLTYPYVVLTNLSSPFSIGAQSDLHQHTLPFALLRRFILEHKKLLCPNTAYPTPHPFAPRGDT